MFRNLFSFKKLSVVLLLAVTSCVSAPEAPPTLELSPTDFRSISGWERADVLPTLEAYKQSCSKLNKKAADATFTVADQTRQYGQLQQICRQLESSTIRDNGQARRFIETYFQPYTAHSSDGEPAFYTGYYEIELEASRTPSAEYRWPIYAVPDQLVTVNIQDFIPSLPDKKLTGLVDKDKVVPVPDHKAIRAGALKGKAKVIAYAKDWADLYFLHIQGSGMLRFPDGSEMRIGYAGKNGQAYTSIGKRLIEQGIIAREDMTAPVLMQWLKDNPTAGQALIEENASYVFFRENGTTPPIGAQGVSLTPGYSLAVDPSYHTYGLPLWVDTMLPATEGASSTRLQRLFVAQDTGGAIRGTMRADIFFGHGQQAAYYAGHIKEPGSMMVLLPR